MLTKKDKTKLHSVFFSFRKRSSVPPPRSHKIYLVQKSSLTGHVISVEGHVISVEKQVSGEARPSLVFNAITGVGFMEVFDVFYICLYLVIFCFLCLCCLICVFPFSCIFRF